MTGFDIDRRKVLKAGGVAVTIAVAGCLGDDDDTDDDAPEEVANHMSDANAYDGVEDHTGESSVTIDNGTNGPDYAFEPAAIQVDPGTEVTWTWVSDGHSVESVDGPEEFDSGIENEGFEFSHTFEEEGISLYQCGPHQAIGHLGAVVVE